MANVSLTRTFEMESDTATTAGGTGSVAAGGGGGGYTAQYRGAGGFMDTIDFDDFLRVELRVGRVRDARPFPEARRPAYILEVDFGAEIGVRRASAQVTERYRPEELVGRQVVAVVNFPPKQIGPVRSECLVTGFHDENGAVALCVPDAEVPLGTRLL